MTERSGSAIYSILESDSPSNYTKMEGIYINGKQFTRILNNPWVEETKELKPPTNNYEIVLGESIYKSLGDSVLNDKKVKLYKSIETRTSINKETRDESIWYATTTYWFSESGLLVKKERILELTMKPKQKEGDTTIRKETKAVTKSVTITEIDPNIKIEAPQIG